MRQIRVQLFGAFRDYQPEAEVRFELPDDARVADVRQALAEHAEGHWPGFRAELLNYSALASESCVLRDSEPLPEDGRLAILPPVNGG